jgi:hypothetical protein
VGDVLLTGFCGGAADKFMVKRNNTKTLLNFI